MRANQFSSTSRGLVAFGLLAVLFIELKLTDNIDWSWWWVLSPLLAPAGLIAGIFGFIIFFAGFIALLIAVFDR